VYDLKTFYVDVTGKIPRSSFGEIWSIMSAGEFVMGIKSYYRFKRLMDISFSLLGLVLTLPLFLLLPPVIKLSSRGSVFFVQERLGWNKRPFKLIKFRTMKTNAEQENGPQWAAENDPRITRMGKLLRKIRLDELPQLINVLKGEMSIVGTRPIRKHFADLLAEEIPYYDLRFFIKPGLTGWSQVKYDYAGSIEGQVEKFKYELFYLKNMSFVLDMIIILKTIKTIFGLNGN
jgi:lipopolysaccharide/colanic/teichoic acid biosynthesis glycosyltransferase